MEEEIKINETPAETPAGDVDSDSVAPEVVKLEAGSSLVIEAVEPEVLEETLEEASDEAPEETAEARGWEGERFTRTFAVDRSGVNEETRSVNVAFSSELPVERGWGVEVLDHSPKSIRTERISDGAPLLLEHDPTKHIGIIENISIGEDRVARANVRFGNSALAEETFQDVKDGIKRHISVGYVIYNAENSQDGGRDIYRATDWEPLEISWVSIPADHHVGIGRSIDCGEKINPISLTDQNHKEVKIMSDNDTKTEVQDVRAQELGRIGDLEKLGEAHGQTAMARDFINSGKSVEEFRSVLLAKIASKPTETAEIGLTESERRNWSWLKAIRALANPNDRRAQEEASFELEASNAQAQKTGRESRGLTVPAEVLYGSRAAMDSGDGPIGTDHMGANFIEYLRAQSKVLQHCTVLNGLQGNLSIPRQNAGSSVAFVAENTAVAEQTPTTDSVAMAPSALGAYVDMTRQLLLQSDPSVEALVKNDLSRAIASKIDQTVLNGSGTGAEPTGLLNLSGMNTVSHGTDGGADTWALAVEHESLIMADNVDSDNFKWVLHPSVIGALKTITKDSGSGRFIMENGEVNGFEVISSTNCPSNLVKGTGTGLYGSVFGDFSQAMVGFWGGLDLMVDPYSLSTKGSLRIVAIQDLDFNVRHKEAFSISVDTSV